jgi:hypothetical protein
MIKFLLLISNIVLLNFVNGQEIFTTRQTGISSSIVSINPENCEEKIVCALPDYEVTELTFHPNGNLFVIGHKKNSNDFSLIELELNSCTVKSIYPLPEYFDSKVFFNHIGLCAGNDGNIYIGTTFLTKFDVQTKKFIKMGDLKFPFRFVHDMSLINGKIMMCVSQFIYPIEFTIEIDLDQIENSKISALELCGINTFRDCNSSNVFYMTNYGLNKYNSIDKVPMLVCPFNSLFGWHGLASKSEFLIPHRTLDLGPDHTLCRSESHIVTVPTQAGDQVKWRDGSTQTQRTLTDPGQYIATITTKEGCMISDTIMISRSYQKVNKTINIALCDGMTYTYKGVAYQAGKIIIDSLPAATGCDTLLTIALDRKATPTILRDTMTCTNAGFTIQNKAFVVGDTILRFKPATMACDTMEQIVYRRYYLPTYSITPTDTVLCAGATTSVRASASHGIRWSTGATTQSVTLGTGKYTVTFTDSNGCQVGQSFELKQSPALSYEIQTIDPICTQANGIIRLINKNMENDFTVLISGETITGKYKDMLSAGTHKLTLTDRNGCITKDSVVLVADQDFEVSLATEVSVERGKQVYIRYQTHQKIDTILFLPDTDILNKADTIHIAGTEDRTYSITFIDENGCRVVKTLKVEVITSLSSLVMPNVVSLLGMEDENKSFYLKAEGITYDMTIYDRWGNVMYDVKKATGGDSSAAWRPQSTSVTQGVYVYLLTIYTEDGVVTRYGSVTVL